MQRWGHTPAGRIRFFCLACRKSEIWKRDDVAKRHLFHQLDSWLAGKESLKEIASRTHRTRQALWKEFHPLFDSTPDPVIPPRTKTRMLVLDATYIHGHSLCALIAIDENDKIFWRFAPYESYDVWYDFLSSFIQPHVVVMDGQKGLFAAAKTLWPTVRIQRCQFHVVSFAIQYLGRHPKEEAGQAILEILYKLKEARTFRDRDRWLLMYRVWEVQYKNVLSAKTESGHFQYPRLRSTRLIIRRALPNLFTYLSHRDTPNTTNLVEGWVNSAIAEALRLHRGLRLHEKKTLVTIILPHLRRQKPQKRKIA